MQTLELSRMGLVPMNDLEMIDIDGGSWPKWVKGITFTWLADQIIDNWEDIKKGLSDGYHS